MWRFVLIVGAAVFVLTSRPSEKQPRAPDQVEVQSPDLAPDTGGGGADDGWRGFDFFWWLRR